MMKRKNDGEMNFKRVCKCSKHDEWGQPPLIVLSNKKNYRANVVASMKQEKYLTSHANFLCIYCYDTFRNQIGDSKSFKNEFAEAFDKVESLMQRNMNAADSEYAHA